MIKSAIENIAKFVGTIAQKVAPYASGLATITTALLAGDMKTAGEAGDKLGLQTSYDIISALLGEDTAKEKLDEGQIKTKLINEINKEAMNKYGKYSNIDFYDLSPNLQAAIIAFRNENKKNGNFSQVKNLPKIKDGIMRPDGTVTQVAPDDWVFAARNLGDLARAFVPQNHTSVSGGEYVINQTFNINGGNDMPQVLRQQAYKGTQEGLLEMMTQSTRKLQLMSGTR